MLETESFNFPLFQYVRLPAIHISDEERKEAGAKEGCSNYEFLKCLARTGFKKKCPSEDNNAYVERAKTELEIVERLGFVDYFLLVWRIMKKAREKKIATDYGRGSCGGSLVLYLIGVTKVDPIKYGLYFERFISEVRAKKKVVDGITYIDGGLAPDIDMDFEQARRNEVIQDLYESYPGKVCKISTVSTLSGKILVKEVGKIVLGMNEDDTKIISDLIPKEFGNVWDIEYAAEGKKNKETGEWDKEPVPAFAAWCKKNKEAYEIALSLRDIIKNKGSHPSGYVVAYDNLVDFLPVELLKPVEGDGEEEASSSFEMGDVAYLTIKVDLLGVRCCSVIADVLNEVGMEMEDINVDSDPIIYDNLQDLRTPHGIFQIEAPTNLKVAKAAKPKNLKELSDVLAIARPGALDFLSQYKDNSAEKIHPLIDNVLANTRGVNLYQEQTMQLFVAIGFTREEAEIIRRVIGKKKREEVDAWKPKIYAKCVEAGLDQKIADLVWKISEDSASYSFNFSHSLAYASLSAACIYLKFKYPLQFFCSLLKQAKNEPDAIGEIAKIHEELHMFGIKLLPPCLMKSKDDFTIEGQNIRFGLSSIKGISDKTVANLHNFKNPDANRFQIFESAANAGVSTGVLSALIQAGCMDDSLNGATRSSLVLQSQLWGILTEKERRLLMPLGEKFRFNLFEVYKHARTLNDEKGKPYIKDSRHATIMKSYKPKKAIYDENSKHEQLVNFFYEQRRLGYCYSTKLSEVFRKYFPDVVDIRTVQNEYDDSRVVFVAMLSDKPKETVSKKKNKYAKFQLSDETGTISAMLFGTANNDRLSQVKFKHSGELPKEEAIVLVSGQKKGDTVFIDDMVDQQVKIYSKFGEMEKKTEEAAPESTL